MPMRSLTRSANCGMYGQLRRGVELPVCMRTYGSSGFSPAFAMAVLPAASMSASGRIMGVDVTFLDPREFTASTLPDLPIDFDIMTCPRSMKDMSSKVGLGYIGPKVRALVRHAPFPVLIPAAVFKPFNSLVVFFGGSDYSRRALSVAREMAAKTRLPLSLFTVLENQDEAHYRRILEQEGLLAEIESGHIKWQLAGGQPLREAFYGVPHDALVVAGAFGHGVVRDIVFGSMLEQIQTILPNNLLIVGPQCVHL